jgi:hypothetical protein
MEVIKGAVGWRQLLWSSSAVVDDGRWLTREESYDLSRKFYVVFWGTGTEVKNHTPH